MSDLIFKGKTPRQMKPGGWVAPQSIAGCCKGRSTSSHSRCIRMHGLGFWHLWSVATHSGDLSLTIFVPFTVISCKALVLPLCFGNLVLQRSRGSDERSFSASVPRCVLLLWCVEEDVAPELHEPLLQDRRQGKSHSSISLQAVNPCFYKNLCKSRGVLCTNKTSVALRGQASLPSLHLSISRPGLWCWCILERNCPVSGWMLSQILWS